MTAVSGPALPDLGDVASEFPRWHCWQGISGLLYARLVRSSPPLVVRAGSPLALLTAIRAADAGVRH